MKRLVHDGLNLLHGRIVALFLMTVFRLQSIKLLIELVITEELSLLALEFLAYIRI